MLPVQVKFRIVRLCWNTGGVTEFCHRPGISIFTVWPFHGHSSDDNCKRFPPPDPPRAICQRCFLNLTTKLQPMKSEKQSSNDFFFFFSVLPFANWMQSFFCLFVCLLHVCVCVCVCCTHNIRFSFTIWRSNFLDLHVSFSMLFTSSTAVCLSGLLQLYSLPSLFTPVAAPVPNHSHPVCARAV